MDKFKVIDLFSGIGGFSLGLEETGHFETVAFCEIEKYPQKILKKHWPDVPIYEDVKNVTAERLRTDGVISNGDRIVVTGGFPCQDISVAGNQKGITAERSGLWSELHRIIGELRPEYALVENVSALLSGPGEQPGEWFGKILGDLAEIGFDARWYSIQASDMGAPHKRNRVWILAYPNDNANETDSRKTRKKERIQKEHWEKGLSRQSGRTNNDTTNVADTNSGRSFKEHSTTISRENERLRSKYESSGSGTTEDVADSDSRLCGRGGTIGQSGEDKERRLYSEKEEQTTHDLRSKTIGCDTVRGKTEDVADSNSERPQRFREKRHSMGETGLRNRETRRKKNVWASESFICDLVDGLPSELADRVRRKLDDNGIAYRDREVPKLGTGISDRVAKLKALGNSIVPQIATLLGDTIIRHESERNS